MASNSDKTADSTSGEVTTPNTDALLAPPPEGSHPTHLSEELGSQTIDAPFDAIPGDLDGEMSLVPTTTNDCLPSDVCAAGNACRSLQGLADLSGCIHRCWVCGGRVHSLLLCGISLESFLCDNPLLIGHQLPNGKVMKKDSDNETRCVCYSCVTNLLAASMPAATLMDNNDSVQLSNNDTSGTNSMVGDVPPPLDNNSVQLSTNAGDGAIGKHSRRKQLKLPMTRKSNTSPSDSSSGDDDDEPGAQSSVRSSRGSLSSYYYYPPFTMYRKWYGKRPDNDYRYEYLIIKAMRSRCYASNRSNQSQKIVDKWNQPSKSKVPLTTIDDDLHIGDDGLFSQSTFKHTSLSDKEYLNSLCPTETLLPRISIQDQDLSFPVEQLYQAVLHLQSLQNKRESLSILKKKGVKSTINVFRIPASECCLGPICATATSSQRSPPQRAPCELPVSSPSN